MTDTDTANSEPSQPVGVNFSDWLGRRGMTMTDMQIVADEVREAMVPMSDALGAALDRLEAMERDALRFRWLAERTAATGLERWVHPFQFLCEAVDERMKAGATMRD